jgi:hypothetical protein
MENICQYCNTPFHFQRSTRRYCSNTCRQLDYYKRKKDFTVAGYFGVNKEGDTVDSFTVKPLSVKEKEVSVKQNADSVKDFTRKSLGVKADSQQVRLSDQQLDLLAEKVLALLEDRMRHMDYRKSSGVKDTLSVKDTIKDTVKEPELYVDSTGDNVKEPDTAKEAEQKREYQPVQSRFIASIAQHLDRNNSAAMSKFRYPHKHWSAEYGSKVKWVSLRFRCLIECLIQFCKFRVVDGEDLQDVADAFYSLGNSRAFKALKADYPHKELVLELSDRINYMAALHNGKENARFFFSPDRLAELMATRHEIGSFVPKVNFRELDFSEMK